MENFGSIDTTQAKMLQGTVTSTNGKEHATNLLSKISQHFAQALTSIRNYLPNCFTDLFHGSLSDLDVKNLHLDFAAKLEKVANPVISSNPISKNQPNGIKGDAMKRANLISILNKARTTVGNDAVKSESKLDSVIKFLARKEGDELDVVENAYVSYLLEATLDGLGEVTETAYRQLAKDQLSLIEFLDGLGLTREDKNELLSGSQLTFTKFLDGLEVTTEEKNKRRAKDLFKNSERKFNELQRHNNVVDIIKILKDKAGKGMQRLAKNQIIAALDDKYRPQLKVGYSRTITFDGSLGVATGSPINIEGVVGVDAHASLDIACNVQWMLDDEGYIAIVKSGAFGGTAGIEANFGLASASAQAKGNKSTGDYKEVKTSREFVTYLLPEFIRDREHRTDPDIAPYLSRSSILAHALATDGVSQDFALWAVTREEVVDVELFKGECDLVSNHHDMLLSLFISSTTLDLEPGVVSDKVKDLKRQTVIDDNPNLAKDIVEWETLPYSEKNAEKNAEVVRDLKVLALRYQIDCNAVIADKSIKTITSKAINVSNVTPAEANLVAYTGKVEAEAKVGLDVLGVMDFASAGIAGSYTKKYRRLKDIKTTSPCLIIADRKSDEEKARIKELILNDTTKTIEEKEKLIELMLKESMKSTEEQSRIKEQLSSQFDEFKNSVFGSWIKETKKSDSPFLGLGQEKESDLFELLKNDFTFYTNLQIRMAAGRFTLQDRKTLKDFEARYGVVTKEQLLHRMTVANACLLSNIEGNEDNDVLLKADMLAFEQAVLSPPFEVDKKYMKKYAYYQESMDFTASEDIYSGQINFTVVLDGCTFKFEYINRERNHINELRDGFYNDVKFSIGGAVTNVSALMKAVAQSITMAKGMAPAVANKILADMTSVLAIVEPTGAYGLEKDYLLRYFKPREFGGTLPEKLLFYRESIEELFKIGLKLSTAVLPVNVTVGAGYTDLSTGSVFEEFSSDTFIYALIFGMHEYAIAPGDKSSFDITQNEKWIEIKKLQDKFFRQSFARYAAELRTGKVESGSLSQEIEAFEKEINSNEHLTPAQKAAFKSAKIEFQNAVLDSNFVKVITSFEKLMHAYSAHWLDKRANSSHYQGGHLPELEVPRDIVALRLQEAKFQQARFEQDCYQRENDPFAGFLPPSVTGDLMHHAC